jgi:hypothetical protein
MQKTRLFSKGCTATTSGTKEGTQTLHKHYLKRTDKNYACARACTGRTHSHTPSVSTTPARAHDTYLVVGSSASPTCPIAAVHLGI